MRRWVSIAAFGLILLSLPTWAQRRGGGAHFSSGGAFASHSSGSFHSGNFGHGSGVRLQAGRSFNHHRGFSRGFNGRRFFYPYYGAYYPWYPDAFDYDSENDDRTAVSYPDVNYSGPYRQDQENGLQREVQTLSGKIDRLQVDVEARNRPKSEEPATALVFRDQHVEEVHNYAIAGGTLWVLNDQAAKKIPLAQLDLAATVKMNDDRGVDFQVPR
jgi:hypothetical protein